MRSILGRLRRGARRAVTEFLGLPRDASSRELIAPLAILGVGLGAIAVLLVAVI